MSSVSQTPNNHPHLCQASPGASLAAFPHLASARPGTAMSSQMSKALRLPKQCVLTIHPALGHGPCLCLPRAHRTSPLPHHNLGPTRPCSAGSHRLMGSESGGMPWRGGYRKPWQLLARGRLRQSFGRIPVPCPRPPMPTLTPLPASGWHGPRPAPQPPWTQWDRSSCWPRRSPRRLCGERVAEPDNCPAGAHLLGDPDTLLSTGDSGSDLTQDNRGVLGTQPSLLCTLAQHGLRAPEGLSPGGASLLRGVRAGLLSWDYHHRLPV